MSREIEIAYPLLLRQWTAAGGHGRRLRPPGVKGVPDFLLAHPATGLVVAEVKAVDRATHAIGLEPAQAEMLDRIARYGGRACVLALDLESRFWAGFGAGCLEALWRSGDRDVLRWRSGEAFRAVTPIAVLALTLRPALDPGLDPLPEPPPRAPIPLLRRRR